MGFHICHLCGTMNQPSGHRFPPTSSGDVTLVFENGHAWRMPDMILHYVADHGWVPPEEFVNDVMHHHQFVPRVRSCRVRIVPESVGYLTGEIVPGRVPDNFVDRLEACMQAAAESGQRRQTRSFRMQTKGQ
jgi:hypothetical protein